MRSASSYRGAKKKAAREAGVPFDKYNEHYAKSRVHAAVNMVPHPPDIKTVPPAVMAAARESLAKWAAQGGRTTMDEPPASAGELEALNRTSVPSVPPPTIEQTVEGVKKLTAADVDKALEATLSAWQKAGHEDALPLSKIFSARARHLGWVEGVEFTEVVD